MHKINRLHIGVLGCAGIAKRFVIPAIKELHRYFKLVGVASRTVQKADDFAATFQTNAFYGYDDLLNIKELDAVYIPLPNSLHYEWIKIALNQGLHVLVEKSMACNYEEVKELNALAKEKDLVLIENFQFRFHSQLQFIKNLVDNKYIGELRNITSAFGFPPFKDEDNIRYQKGLGGGALLDAGAYPLKITQIFLGKDINVVGANLVYPQDKEVDISGSAYLKQRNGDVTSQIAFGFDHFYQNNITLWGSKGLIRAHRIFTAAPGFQPVIDMETMDEKKSIILPADNHFINMLMYFHKIINDSSKFEEEYLQNVNQARLIKELYIKVVLP